MERVHYCLIKTKVKNKETQNLKKYNIKNSPKSLINIYDTHTKQTVLGIIDF